ncbi:MAG: site-specific integrase [Candidatus Tenebribacter davisii]|nr:site-specific integrase [Candidatus Tenebribacter davisii]
MYEKLLKEIRKFNQKSIFKIKYRKLKEKYTLFLELQRDGNRKTINIENCFVKGLTSSYINDKRMVHKASQEQQVYDKQYEFKKDTFLRDIKIKSSNVVTFFESIKESKKSKATRRSWNNTINYFKEFTKGKLTFKEINLEFSEKFRRYLLTQVSENSTATYFSVFKAMLNHAVKHNILVKNPAKFVLNPKKRVEREFLLLDEIKLLASTDSYRPQTTNAFLFSCFTGLRISDIRNLTWSNITKDSLEYTQQKTGISQKMKINESALGILKEQKASTKGKRVFEVPRSDSNSNKHLKKWVNRAGIKKHITFHCSRHTFATLCLTYDVDLYTVSKLLGHTDIKNTQIYAKLIDKKKDQAIDKLPVL